VAEPECIALGQKALARRRALKLTRREIALQIGVASHRLVCWERALPFRPNVELESKWEEALGVAKGWLHQIGAHRASIAKIIELQRQVRLGLAQ